jgi:hypothetical protein
MTTANTLYTVLGVAPDAGSEEIDASEGRLVGVVSRSRAGSPVQSARVLLGFPPGRLAR